MCAPLRARPRLLAYALQADAYASVGRCQGFDSDSEPHRVSGLLREHLRGSKHPRQRAARARAPEVRLTSCAIALLHALRAAPRPALAPHCSATVRGVSESAQSAPSAARSEARRTPRARACSRLCWHRSAAPCSRHPAPCAPGIRSEAAARVLPPVLAPQCRAMQPASGAVRARHPQRSSGALCPPALPPCACAAQRARGRSELSTLRHAFSKPL